LKTVAGRIGILIMVVSEGKSKGKYMPGEDVQVPLSVYPLHDMEHSPLTCGRLFPKLVPNRGKEEHLCQKLGCISYVSCR